MLSEVSDGQIFILFLWITAVLVLFSIRRHLKFLNTKRMVASFAAISFFALIAAWPGVFFHNNTTAPYPNRIAIYAMPVSTQAAEARLQPESIAIAELAIAAFPVGHADDFYAYPLDWLYEPLSADSVADVAYLARAATRLSLPYFVIGEITSGADSSQMRFQIFSTKNTQPLDLASVRFAKDSIRLAAQSLVDKIAETLKIEQGVLAVPDRTTEYYRMRLAAVLGDRQRAAELAYTQMPADSADPSLWLPIAEQQFSAPNLVERSKKDREQSLRRLSQKLADLSDRDSSNVALARLAAEGFYWREKFNRAAMYTLRALRHSPYGDSKVYNLLAQLHYSRYRPLGFANEIEIYNQALRCNPGDLESVLDLAGVHMLLKQTVEAQKLLEKYRAIFPDNLQLLRALGEIYVIRGVPEKIFATYEQILQHDPGDADAYYNLGIYYLNSADTLTARRFFDRALATGNHLDSRLYLAKIAEKQHDFDSAITYLRERIRLKTSEDDAYAEEARRHLFDLMRMLGKIDSTGKVIE